MHKLRVLTIAVALVAAAAAAQTSSKSASSTAKTTTHTAGSSALPKNIPPVHGVVHTAYSLRYIDVVVGKGPEVVPPKMLTVNYTGWLRSNGTEFDSSIPDKEHPQRKPLTFPVGLHRVIPGFDTAFDGMRVGGKRRIYVPFQLAYGYIGTPPMAGKPPVIPPKSDLVFDVELLNITEIPKAPERPAMQPRPGAPGAFAPRGPSSPGSVPPVTKPGSAPQPAAPATAPPAPTAPTAQKPAAPANTQQ